MRYISPPRGYCAQTKANGRTKARRCSQSGSGEVEVEQTFGIHLILFRRHACKCALIRGNKAKRVAGTVPNRMDQNHLPARRACDIMLLEMLYLPLMSSWKEQAKQRRRSSNSERKSGTLSIQCLSPKSLSMTLLRTGGGAKESEERKL